MNSFLFKVTKYIQSPSFLHIFIPSVCGLSVVAFYSFHLYMKNKLKPTESELSPVTKFVEGRRKQFLELYTDTTVDTNGNVDTNANANIDDLFYDYEQYKNISTNCSDLETLWKSRIMFDTTPSGNIIMYYDVYKHGFVYASDQTISYNILCGSAMKYCKIFYCRDFFRDNQYIPNNQLSPFTLMDIDQEKMEKRKKIQKRKDLRLDFDSDAFLKPKPKPKPDETNTPLNRDETKPKSDETKPNDFYKNIFQHIGKMRNVSILQPLEYKKNNENRQQQQQEKIGSYSSYKKNKQNKQNNENDSQFNHFFMVDHVDMNVLKYG